MLEKKIDEKIDHENRTTASRRLRLLSAAWIDQFKDPTERKLLPVFIWTSLWI